MMPVSLALGLRMWSSAPQMCMRISLLALPPGIGRACTSAVRAPCRAAAIAAQRPLMPPPTTTKSKESCSMLPSSPYGSTPHSPRRFCSNFTSNTRGVTFRFTHRLAATPAACPILAQIGITR